MAALISCIEDRSDQQILFDNVQYPTIEIPVLTWLFVNSSVLPMDVLSSNNGYVHLRLSKTWAPSNSLLPFRVKFLRMRCGFRQILTYLDSRLAQAHFESPSVLWSVLLILNADWFTVSIRTIITAIQGFEEHQRRVRRNVGFKYVSAWTSPTSPDRRLGNLIDP